MVLGIKLEIDKSSVKSAAKQLKGGVDSGSRGMRKKFGLGTAAGAVTGSELGSKDDPKTDKKVKKGKDSGLGALAGGFIGAIVGSLKPIQELLGVVAGIMQLFLVPILILLKPFLVLFLKVGMALIKAFTSEPGSSEAEKSKNKTGTIFGVIGAALAGVAAFFMGIPGLLIAALTVAAFFLVKGAFKLGVWLGEKFHQAFQWVLDNVITPVAEWLGNAVKVVGEALLLAWDWVKNAASTIWNWFVTGFKVVLEFGSKIWGWFVTGFEAVSEFGSKIWNIFVDGLTAGAVSVLNFGKLVWGLFVDGLSFISNLGKKIWSWMKDALGSFFGGDGADTSVDDALISSTGQITKLNPNDNVLAFQDMSQVQNIANSNGGSRGGSVIINVEGFIGSDQDLADKVAKALSQSTRGSVSNFG